MSPPSSCGCASDCTPAGPSRARSGARTRPVCPTVSVSLFVHVFTSTHVNEQNQLPHQSHRIHHSNRTTRHSPNPTHTYTQTRQVDATYLSPHVNLAARMETAASQYGVPLLMTDSFHEARLSIYLVCMYTLIYTFCIMSLTPSLSTGMHA